jgi:hypothetical protein
MPKTLLIYSAAATSATNTFLNTFGGGAGNANEVDVEQLVTKSGTLSNLRTFVASGGDGLNTLTVRKNAADTAITCNRTGVGLASDLTHTATFVPGDVFCVGTVSAGTSPNYKFITANCEFDDAHGAYHTASNYTGIVCDVGDATQYLPINGSLAADGTATEANAQWKVRGYTSIDTFQVRVSANARVNDSTFKLRVNGVDVAASTLTVEAAVTGLFVVSDLNLALSPGDLVCASITLLTGVQDLTITSIGVTCFSTSNASEVWTATHQGIARTASGTASYYVPGGTISALTDLTNLSVTPGFPADIKNLRIYIAANTYAANATLDLMVNGVSAMTTTLTAAATGWLENTSDTVTISSTDTVLLRIVGGTSGSITITAMGFTLWVPTPVNPAVTTKTRHGGGPGPGPKRRIHPWPEFTLVDA